MNSEDKRNYTLAWLVVCTMAAFVWLVLIVEKAFGHLPWGWPATLLSITWLPFLMALLLALAVIGCELHDKFKKKRRQKKKDRRIIRQAKAIGVWDKKPIVLGGRALELKAWKLRRIKRKPGETDRELRARLNAADKEKKEDE